MKHSHRIATFLALSLLGAACTAGGASGPSTDPGLEGLELTSVNPGSVVPGSLVVVAGRSFVGDPWGTSVLRLRGTLGGAAVDAAVPLGFADFERMEVTVDQAFFDAIGGQEGQFEGSATVEVDSPVDGLLHESNSIDVSLGLFGQLTPEIETVASGLLIFVNDKIVIEGDGLLLGGGEGTTFAVVDGCFTAVGDEACVPVGPVEVPVLTQDFDRTGGVFEFAPTIAGIRPGGFEGRISLLNRHEGGPETASGEASVTYDVTEPALFTVSPTAASLGQYIDIEGGGFVGGDQGGLTLVELTGTFTPVGGEAMPVALTLVPEWVEGRVVRYVMSEDDALGTAIDLRKVTGMFSGDVRPIVSYGDDEVVGQSSAFSLSIAPVRQVVYLEFEAGYVESLRHFGLRALDQQIRKRIIDIVKRDYTTVNMDVRLEPPTDFALYSTVEISGPDPNGIGLLGYDNSPGKDTGNKRLYDLVGGVNALTQGDTNGDGECNELDEDPMSCSPGYGGVFIESLFAFSEHPGDYAEPAEGQTTPLFDQLFDPFRPDRDGTPVTSADFSGGSVPELSSSDSCPAEDRQGQVSCAVWAMGSLIGTTLSHEMGHSLGLANPFGEGFHNSSDEPNRMMDNGGDRPFTERAELEGDGPGRFCVTEYDYLRDILPTTDPDDPTDRPTCF